MISDPDVRPDLQTIKSLHFLLLEHDLSKSPGRIRQTEIYVHDEASDQLVYRGPDPEVVPPLMRELADEPCGDQWGDPIVAAAMAHLNLVMIHPFRDGNGRMARILQTFSCSAAMAFLSLTSRASRSGWGETPRTITRSWPAPGGGSGTRRMTHTTGCDSTCGLITYRRRPCVAALKRSRSSVGSCSRSASPWASRIGLTMRSLTRRSDTAYSVPATQSRVASKTARPPEISKSLSMSASWTPMGKQGGATTSPESRSAPSAAGFGWHVNQLQTRSQNS